MTETASSATQKRDITKLQRIVVEALEDVKASDLQVFNTEHLSSLFDRVVLASGTSNRQTRALASSVRDKVREAGYPKPRLEGEDNGEWIVVDCGSVVAHVMQPAIRQYYHLEDIWGEKPVRVKPVAAEKAAQKRQKGADDGSDQSSNAVRLNPAPTKARSAPRKSVERAAAVKNADTVSKGAVSKNSDARASHAPMPAAVSPVRKATVAKTAVTSKKVATTRGVAPKTASTRVKVAAAKKTPLSKAPSKKAVASAPVAKKSLSKSAGATPKA